MTKITLFLLLGCAACSEDHTSKADELASDGGAGTPHSHPTDGHTTDAGAAGAPQTATTGGHTTDSTAAGAPHTTTTSTTATIGGVTSGTLTTCAEETRAEKFVAGMSKTSASGMQVALVEAEPAPPERLDNSWVLSVMNADGEPVEGAALTLNPQMPDHGHGSPREAVVKELGDGKYRVEPISLFMPGYWTVEVSVALDDAPAESVQFGFCVS